MTAIQTELDPAETAHNGKSKVERYKWSDPHKKGEMCWVDKNRIQIDDRYQRDATNQKVSAIAANFAWPVFGVLIVARRKDGSLFAVDGQHRLLGARRRSDIRDVPCIVFESEGLGAEAKTFLDAQMLRKPVSAIDKFKAQIVACDPITLAIQDLAKASGRVIGKSSSPTSITCVAMLRRTMIIPRTRECLERLWPMIVNLASAYRMHEQVVEALVFIESHIEGRSLLEQKWSTRLSVLGWEGLLKAAKSASAYYARGGAAVWAGGIVDALNKGLQEKSYLRLVGLRAPKQDAAATD